MTDYSRLISNQSDTYQSAFLANKMRLDEGIPCGGGYIAKGKECHAGKGGVRSPGKKKGMSGRKKAAMVAGGVAGVAALGVGGAMAAKYGFAASIKGPDKGKKSGFQSNKTEKATGGTIGAATVKVGSESKKTEKSMGQTKSQATKQFLGKLSTPKKREQVLKASMNGEREETPSSQNPDDDPALQTKAREILANANARARKRASQFQQSVQPSEAAKKFQEKSSQVVESNKTRFKSALGEMKSKIQEKEKQEGFKGFTRTKRALKKAKEQLEGTKIYEAAKGEAKRYSEFSKKYETPEGRKEIERENEEIKEKQAQMMEDARKKREEANKKREEMYRRHRGDSATKLPRPREFWLESETLFN